MQKIGIDEIKKDIPLSKYILFDEYFIVISKYVRPTAQDIERITHFELSPLYGEGETKPTVPAQAPIVEEAGHEVLPTQEPGRPPGGEEKKDVYEVLISYLTSLFSACRNKKVSLENIRKTALLTTGFALKRKEEALIGVARGRKKNRISAHVLNTGILTAILASSVNIEGKQLIDTVCGAIMHDIGILLLNFQGPVKKIEMHTVLGGNYLKTIEGCSSMIFMPAFQHHEKADGSGYPAGLTLSNTAFVSQIVSICDSCDSHTSYIRLGEDLSLHLKKEELFIWKKEDFDTRLFSLLAVELFRIFEEGRRVLLNDGRIGVIAKTTPRFPVSPVIIPVPDSTPSDPVELLKSGDIWIERFL
jgi:HD-GYP domain-containing protein (c-di-GMP phosphodiesterase class II)